MKVPSHIDKRQFAFNEEDREYVLRLKFGDVNYTEVQEKLMSVQKPSNQILGAIAFLAKPGDMGSLARFVTMANDEEMVLRTAAEVKFEMVMEARPKE